VLDARDTARGLECLVEIQDGPDVAVLVTAAMEDQRADPRGAIRELDGAKLLTALDDGQQIVVQNRWCGPCRSSTSCATGEAPGPGDRRSPTGATRSRPSSRPVNHPHRQKSCRSSGMFAMMVCAWVSVKNVSRIASVSESLVIVGSSWWSFLAKNG